MPSGRGGAGRGQGRKKGTIELKPREKRQNAFEKETARQVLREMVWNAFRPLTQAQIDSAKGISHFLLRDPKTGKFERITDPEQITAALNAEGATEGSTYYIHTKDPSIQAFTDLMNRTIDKPIDAVSMDVTGELKITWQK